MNSWKKIPLENYVIGIDEAISSFIQQYGTKKGHRRVVKGLEMARKALKLMKHRELKKKGENPK